MDSNKNSSLVLLYPIVVSIELVILICSQSVFVAAITSISINYGHNVIKGESKEPKEDIGNSKKHNSFTTDCSKDATSDKNQIDSFFNRDFGSINKIMPIIPGFVSNIDSGCASNK